MNARPITLLVLAAALLTLSACSSLKPSQAPFHVFNSALLNADVGAHYPREPITQGIPNQPIAWTDEGAEDVPTDSDGDNTEAVEEEIAAVEPTKPAPKAPVKPAPRSVAYSPRDAAAYIGALCKVNKLPVDIERDDDAIASLYATIKERGRIYHATRPTVGDVVFFHNTWDRNGDERNNDWYTHVGVVERVDKDGTIHFLSFYEGKVREDTINLEHPNLAKDSKTGAAWNSALRRRQPDDPPFTQYLASDLFAGFGNILGDRTEFIIIDNWVPGMLVSQL